MPFYNINEMETKKDKTGPDMAATVVDDGELSQDYNEAPNAAELKNLLAGND